MGENGVTCAPRPDEVSATLEPFMTRRRIAQAMKAEIADTAAEMMRNRSCDSEWCALFLAACHFIRENHLHFFTSCFYKNEYYAMRLVVKTYVLLLNDNDDTRRWAMDHGIIPGLSKRVACLNYLPIKYCGCHDKSRVATENHELIAFDQWGPGRFITDVPAVGHARGGVRRMIANDHVWAYQENRRATVWHPLPVPDGLTYDEFHAEFESNLMADHVSWKHNMCDTVAQLRNYDRMFAAPQLSDYAQVMLQIQLKTNENCMRLVDEFCGIF